MKSHNTVDEYILENEYWQDCLLMLREILLSSGTNETIKWGVPVYTYNNKNVAGMAGFKSYVGIWFYQGALLNDEKKKLINASEGAKAIRQWRFNSLEEIESEAENIRNYMLEGIENVKAGREIKPERNKSLIIPDELKAQFKQMPGLQEAFDRLKLTQKREYVAYIGNAKRAETRQNRLNKSIPMIMQGIGIMDRYR